MIKQGKKSLYLNALMFGIVSFVIYQYFFDWKTDVMYGDDLYIFQRYSILNSLSDQINVPVSFEKFRPMQGVCMTLMFNLLGKNLHAYYVFNILIQGLNVILLALIINFYLENKIVSLLLSLLIGVTRFSFFNITQLFNGGALEGLAVTFLLLTIWKVVKASRSNESQKPQLWWAMLFANLAMYTHERYIVLFPFLLLSILVLPAYRELKLSARVALMVGCFASILMNVFVKKVVFGMAFFVGTGGTNIDFSLATAIATLGEALSSLFQFNRGPSYLVGINFASLPASMKAVVFLLAVALSILLFSLIAEAFKTIRRGRKEKMDDLLIFLCLGSLLIMLLVPAVVTIRLEQRWLQGSLSVLLIMISIAASVCRFKKIALRNIILVSVSVLFLVSDHHYLRNGSKYLYMSEAEKLAAEFKKALDDKVIKAKTSRLYIWEKTSDNNTENTILWTLGSGFFFPFHESAPKHVQFVDSIYQDSAGITVHSFPQFDTTDGQIVYLADDILDITGEYMKDSLYDFSTYQMDDLSLSPRLPLDQKVVSITNNDFDKIISTGFYENENGIRWTDGAASIRLKGEYYITDTLRLKLNTFMPQPCKNIVPKILIEGKNIQPRPAVLEKRDNDIFTYYFTVKKLTKVNTFYLLADTIDSKSDSRMLSFPFISLELLR